MTKKELIEALAPYSDDVIIYLDADHGQTPIQASGVDVSKDEEFPVMDFDGDLTWKSPDDVKNNYHVTAVSIVSVR